MRDQFPLPPSVASFAIDHPFYGHLLLLSYVLVVAQSPL
jgi:hypothetical protein